MKVLVIGSGPIVIGQAAEFDYAGTQACLALKDAGIDVILVNSNPATIMTDPFMAKKVYLEPLTVESLEMIIEKERPDGLLPSLGGQTALNLSVDLAKKGILERYDVKLLGTPLEAILKAEDRELFKNLVAEIGIPTALSKTVTSIDEALELSTETGFPLIVRPAFTLGGTGGGVAKDEEQLKEIVERGIKNSRISQVLLEQSLLGYKEIEYEIIRDKTGLCLTICSMENIDPIGVHTGDSIVVAPLMTLTEKQNLMLERAAHLVVERLGIEGGCNVQFALHPTTDEYYIIEVNPRVSRSSALASKATGYPIAKVTALLALGKTLSEIQNPITGETWADTSPKIDHVVVKFPRWPFDKFQTGDRSLGTQMKATGEIMAIGDSLEEALGKAVRSLEIGRVSFLEGPGFEIEMLSKNLSTSSDERFFYLAKALKGGMSVDEAHRLTAITPLFISALKKIVEKDIPKHISEASLLELKSLGFSDKVLSKAYKLSESEFLDEREKLGVKPTYKEIPTQAGFRANSPYFYSTYGKNKVGKEELKKSSNKPKALVIGSGPIRIGQGIEFDYCSVHAVWALQKLGWEAIIINNNPETVSTDFDTADRLYFEPLTKEDVLSVAVNEEVDGVIVQFGGQTAINLAEDLALYGLPVLGTALSAIDLAEDRDKCHKLLQQLGIPQAEGGAATTIHEAMGIGLKLSFPLVVRPSYVIGGRAMSVVRDEDELLRYLQLNVGAEIDERHPVLLDRYLAGKEIEIDAVSDGTNVVIPGIIEHVERAGIHSGDSIAVYPANLKLDEEEIITKYTTSICRALGIRGVVNIQFVIFENKVYVLEINPRGSRTLPIISKVTGVPLIELATKVMLGGSLRDNPYGIGLLPKKPYFAVKVPVFSFAKLQDVEVLLGPEMRSTGEVLGLGKDLKTAMYKALQSGGLELKPGDRVLLTQNGELTPIIKMLEGNGVLVDISSDYTKSRERLKQGDYSLFVSLDRNREDFLLRRVAVEIGVPTISSADTLRVIAENMSLDITSREPISLLEYLEGSNR